MADNPIIKPTTINLYKKKTKSKNKVNDNNKADHTTGQTGNKDSFGFSNYTPPKTPLSYNSNNIPNFSPPAPTNNQNSGFSNQNNNAGYPQSFGYNPNQWGGSNNNNQTNPQGYQQNSYMDPEKKVEFIKGVYQKILGRDPEKKDLNYYKYSTLSEDQIKDKLLNSEEHSTLVKNGQKFKELKRSKESLETRCKSLELKISDQLEEFEQLNILLQQKNNYIASMRNSEIIQESSQKSDIKNQENSSINQRNSMNEENPSVEVENETNTSENSDNYLDIPESPEQFTETPQSPIEKKQSLKDKLIKLIS